MNGEHKEIYDKIDCLDKKVIKIDKVIVGIKKDTEFISKIIEKQQKHCHEATNNFNVRINELESTKDTVMGTVKASGVIIFLVSLITITKLLGWW